MPSENYVIAYADKCVLKFSGLEIRGLDARRLEEKLSALLGSVVRVIGVTGGSIDMDIYGLPIEQLLQNEDGLLRAVSAMEGVKASEIARLSDARHVIPVDLRTFTPKAPCGCAKERWAFLD